MVRGTGRRKVGRQFRLETLEGRALQSVVRPHGVITEARVFAPEVRAFAPNAAPVTLIAGTVRGFRASAGLLAPAQPGYLSFSGHGTSRPLGGVFFGDEHVETPVSTLNQTSLAITRGNAVLTTNFGDKVDVRYAGRAQVVDSRKEIFTLQGAVTSGAKHFNGVTGNFQANGAVDLATGRVNLTFVVTLNYPRPS